MRQEQIKISMLYKIRFSTKPVRIALEPIKMVIAEEMKPRALELIPAVQTYDWGLKGTNSLVARLSSSRINVADETPYAEVHYALLLTS